MMFRERQELRDYFKKCREGLRKEGILVLDIYGGKVDGSALQEFGNCVKAILECAHTCSFFLSMNLLGPESQQPCMEVTKFPDKGFAYHWEQKSFDPITHHVSCAIHFSFPNREMIKDAFSYEFRLWTLPELRDVLLGAHFSEVKVFWEEEHANATDFSSFVESTSAKHEGTWMAYIVSYRS
jgi:hypothetical protein